MQISADESVDVIGTSGDTQARRSGLLAQSDGSGEAGNLTIETGRLLVSDGAVVSAGTTDEGNGGSLQITADESVDVIGGSAKGGFGSGLLVQSNDSGDGNAGDLTINTGRLRVSNGAVVSAGTFGEGKGGNLQITADESVDVIGTSGDTQARRSGLLAQSNGSGDAGKLTINTGRLLVSEGAVVSAGTFGAGKGGSLQIIADESVDVIGTSTDTQPRRSGLLAQSNGSGDAGNLTINTGRLLVSEGAEVSAGTFGAGKGGSLHITADESVDVIGGSGSFGSGLLAQSNGSGDAGNLTIKTERLLVSEGAEVSAGTFGAGKGGNLQITADESVDVIGTSGDGKRLSSLLTQTDGSGDAGNLTIETERLLVSDGAQVSAGTFAQRDGSGNAGNLNIATGRLLVSNGAVISNHSFGEGTAGNINITVRDTLQADNGTIITNTSRSAGGAIAIKAGNIRLTGNSDIITNVNSGAGGGGNIYLEAGSIIAFDDSDILAFARDGKGGDITFNTPAFFGENYRPAPNGTNPDTLNNNNQVDINATGAVIGTVIIPDVSFIQNSLTELPDNQINTDSILANSCIVRRNQPTKGSFTVTGTGGLPQRPGDAQMSSFPTVDVAIPTNGTSSNPYPHRSWQQGDPIVEPQGVYRLPNGKLVLSRECS